MNKIYEHEFIKGFVLFTIGYFWFNTDNNALLGAVDVDTLNDGFLHLHEDH